MVRLGLGCKRGALLYGWFLRHSIASQNWALQEHLWIAPGHV